MTEPTKVTFGDPNDQFHPTNNGFAGHHGFPQGGCFEVFWYDAMAAGDTKDREGWFWHACFPGCLPDGEPSGPFPTAEGAYLDAIGE